jgi:hypothetical protein
MGKQQSPIDSVPAEMNTYQEYQRFEMLSDTITVYLCNPDFKAIF